MVKIESLEFLGEENFFTLKYFDNFTNNFN